MAKELHAVEFDETTFGMPIDATTEAYKKFKQSIKKESAISYFGNEMLIKTVPYLNLASIMQEAHWLVSEKRCFNKIRIDGLGDEEIYVKYSDEIIDFRDRRNYLN